MLKDRIEDSLTFDDVLLLPGHSKLLPSEVSVKSRITQTLGCNIPLLSAAMDTVTEHRTAICIAQEGGMGIIHKNMNYKDQARQVNLVKRSESGIISDPIKVESDEPLKESKGVCLTQDIWLTQFTSLWAVCVQACDTLVLHR